MLALKSSCIMAVLALNIMTSTSHLNMAVQIMPFYHHPTLIGTLHFLKLTTITVSKVIVDVIQFTLRLITFLLVSTVHMQFCHFLAKCNIRNCFKLSFSAAYRTSIIYRRCLPLHIQARLTKGMTTAHRHIRPPARELAYLHNTLSWGVSTNSYLTYPPNSCVGALAAMSKTEHLHVIF